jgi:DNA-directed RNA polymerase specialized sigma24 family protein
MDVRKTSKELIFRLKKGAEAEAWGEFFKNYNSMIAMWAIKADCPPISLSDVVQEVFIQMHRNFGDFVYSAQPGSFRKYLRKVTLGKVNDALRKEYRYNKYKKMHWLLYSRSDCLVTVEAACYQDRLWLLCQIALSLQRTYDKIDKITYQSFRMYVIENLSIEKIYSELKGVTHGAIYQHKNRVLKILHREFIQCLGNSGETVSSREFTGNDLRTFQANIIDIIRYNKLLREVKPTYLQ